MALKKQYDKLRNKRLAREKAKKAKLAKAKKAIKNARRVHTWYDKEDPALIHIKNFETLNL